MSDKRIQEGRQVMRLVKVEKSRFKESVWGMPWSELEAAATCGTLAGVSMLDLNESNKETIVRRLSGIGYPRRTPGVDIPEWVNLNGFAMMRSGTNDRALLHAQGW